MTTISPELSNNLGYDEGEDILYFVVGASQLCLVRMKDIEVGFETTVRNCLNGGNVDSVAPKYEQRACIIPNNTETDIRDVLCGINIPYQTPIAAVDAILGVAILDVYETRQAAILETGGHHVIVYNNGINIGQWNMKTIIQEEYYFREYPPYHICSEMVQQIRVHPEGEHIYTFTNRQVEKSQNITVVAKSPLFNCTVYVQDCNGCLYNPVCGWCELHNRCTLQTQCSSGKWLRPTTSELQNRIELGVIYEHCIYIDLVGNFTVQFSPKSGLATHNATQLMVNVTTEIPLRFYFDQPAAVYVSNNIICGDVQILDNTFSDDDYSYYEFGYNGDLPPPRRKRIVSGEPFSTTTPSSHTTEPRSSSISTTSPSQTKVKTTRYYSYSLMCTLDPPGNELSSPVAVQIFNFQLLSGSFWLNSTERFSFVVPKLRSFDPRKGPRSGGTVIEITGEHLLTGNDIHIGIAGTECRLLEEYSNDTQLICISGAHLPIQHFVSITYNGGYVTQSTQLYAYTDDPVIDTIFPLRTFISGGELQYVTGTNLDSIARPVFVVVLIINDTIVDRFQSICQVHNSTTMTCPSPEIIINTEFNSTRNRRSPVEDSESIDDYCKIIQTTRDGEHIEFRIGFILDGVEAYQWENIQNHLDERFTTIVVAQNPEYYMFMSDNNIAKFNPSEEDYLVIHGERLDCGALKSDIDIHIGTAFCSVVSLYRTQLTCKPPPTMPPSRSEFAASHGFPHVMVKVGQYSANTHLIGYLKYVDDEFTLEPWIIAITVVVVLLLLIAVAVIVLYIIDVQGHLIRPLPENLGCAHTRQMITNQLLPSYKERTIRMNQPSTTCPQIPQVTKSV
uniref:Plexin-B-like n=1 Tax=Saccoglossus kowalevskii TaxID=10224 RepID=A0ABM0MQ90_SACKO|nr:PREDICTED: plexin-B-like [Saccoglossus kowalevskii]